MSEYEYIVPWVAIALIVLWIVYRLFWPSTYSARAERFIGAWQRRDAQALQRLLAPTVGFGPGEQTDAADAARRLVRLAGRGKVPDPLKVIFADTFARLRAKAPNLGIECGQLESQYDIKRDDLAAVCRDAPTSFEAWIIWHREVEGWRVRYVLCWEGTEGRPALAQEPTLRITSEPDA